MFFEKFCKKIFSACNTIRFAQFRTISFPNCIHILHKIYGNHIENVLIIIYTVYTKIYLGGIYLEKTLDLGRKCSPMHFRPAFACQFQPDCKQASGSNHSL